MGQTIASGEPREGKNGAKLESPQEAPGAPKANLGAASWESLGGFRLPGVPRRLPEKPQVKFGNSGAVGPNIINII